MSSNPTPRPLSSKGVFKLSKGVPALLWVPLPITPAANPEGLTPMKIRTWHLPLAALVLSTSACVTINIYFPAAAAEKAADRIIDEVWQLRDSTTRPLAQPANEEQGNEQTDH